MRNIYLKIESDIIQIKIQTLALDKKISDQKFIRPEIYHVTLECFIENVNFIWLLKTRHSVMNVKGSTL